MLEIGQKVRGTVEKVVFGGSGLIRHEGWVIFVQDVAPGEEVEVLITDKKKSYFLARLIDVIQNSPLRIQPRCPYFGSCGGCQLQHLAYEEQLRLKVEWLQDAFIRIAKRKLPETIECVPARQQWAYRHKILLHTQGDRIGYFARDNETLLDITSCPIFSYSPPLFDELKQCLTRLQMKDGTRAEVTVLGDITSKAHLRLFFHPGLPENAQEVHEWAASTFTAFENIWFEDAKKVIGTELSLQRDLAGLRIRYSPKVFVQNYPEQALQIYRDVLALLDREAPLLDLYCGIGSLSLLAAQTGRRVLGVELNAEAICLAKESAKENGCKTAQFIAAAVEDIEKRVNLKEYRAWALNPPRTGLSSEMVEIILKYRPLQLIYISCMPPTLARDMKALFAAGYEIDTIKAYDMFPQTTHLETVACLRIN